MNEKDKVIGYIVLDDYTDPIRSKYVRYETEETAIAVAKNRLCNMLKSENRLEEYESFATELETELEVCIDRISHGWQGDMVLIKVATLYENND